MLHHRNLDFFITMKDPAFLFYPGDYLRDTQILSEASQVAYDRIMCEHMRNICISQRQLKFITKKLNEEENEELLELLEEVDGGYQIPWVAESIIKRRAYSESRRKNRLKKPKENKKNISLSYDSHMENEIENENVIINEKGNENKKKVEIVFPFDTDRFMRTWEYWKEYRRDETGFKYKSHISEQASLKKLSELAKGNESDAVNIIFQSIENGWKGFFELKTQTNGKQTGHSADFERKTAERLGLI